MPESDIETAGVPSRTVRFPRLSVAWSIFAISAFVFLVFGSDWLNENANVAPGVSNILKMLLVLITCISWCAWLMFFSHFRGRFLWGLGLIILAVLFFVNYRLIFDGDLGFVRIESRFLRREFQPPVKSGPMGVDLTKTGSGDFSQFLGNDRNAVVQGRQLTDDWTANPPRLVWKQSIGEGWSGFSAVNGFAVTQEQRGDEECVSCYDVLSGELKWLYAAGRRYDDPFGMGKAGPRATPTVHEGRVYCQGATGIVDCLSGADGTLIWTVDLTERLGIDLQQKTSAKGLNYEFEVSNLAWGRSGSPLVYGNKVIVSGGGSEPGSFTTLIALDKPTGKEIWRGGEQMIAYGSPSVAKLLGQDQITLVAESAAMGFDPESGKVLWTVERSGASNGDANCSQVTPIADNRILLSKGYQKGGQMVELAQGEKAIQTTTVWENSRVLKTKMMSPVIKDGYAYCLSDGFLECCDMRDDAAEGNRNWRVRGRFGNGQLLLVGDCLLVHTEFGSLKLIEASPERYRELGEIKTIDGVCWNTICLYERFLLVRSELEAACFELPMEEPVLNLDAADDEFAIPNADFEQQNR